MLEQAEELFRKIPTTRYLLGICKADIAAAHGNLENYQQVLVSAKESVSLISGDKRFAFTEAMANVTAGNSSYVLSDANSGPRYLNEARRILRKIPEGSQYLAIIDQNERQLRSAANKDTRNF